jgi:NAD(P)-dependent dehydrogenase (short-subunit alcohol dehydrogenase family)
VWVGAATWKPVEPSPNLHSQAKDGPRPCVDAVASKVQVSPVQLTVNAAIGEVATLAETTEAHLDRTFAVNVRGTVLTVQKALPLLNDGASVVLVGSTAAERGTEGFGAYAASKAAVRSFARTWSAELRTRGIRVNVISPAWIETPGGTAAFGDEETARAVKDHVTATVPRGSMGRPEEAAAVVTFLASDRSSYVVGANFYVDGGEDQT